MSGHCEAMHAITHVGGSMAVVGGLIGAAQQGVVAARQQQQEETWASHWARRAAAAERDLSTARDQAAGYCAQWSDAEDRAEILAAENARLRARLDALS